jgi:serine/threonine-protein kinase
VTGFGSSIGSFTAFDKAFTKANGFEAQIGLRLVTIPQCPVVDLLSNARNLAGFGKVFQSWLKIEKDQLKSGQTLRGRLQVPADYHAALLLIDDAGLVHNLESFTRRSNDRLEINIKLVNQGADRAKAQLLLAIVTDKPMSMLTHGSGKPANELFPAVLKEIRETRQSVTFAVKYFKVGG